MRVLIVEDEAKTADYLNRGLSEQGFTVDLADNGIDGRHLALHGEYDVIVLDVMLPGVDGYGVLRALRERRQTPVIMLTARERVEDQVRGLREGRRRLPDQAVLLPRTGRPPAGPDPARRQP